MADHNTAIDVVTATGAAVASKTTYFSAFLAAVASWVTHSPPGVIAGVTIAILTFLVNAGFRTYAGAANTHALNINFPVLMRATPSITLTGSIASANAGSEAVFGANAAQTRWSFASLASGDSYILERLFILNAEL